jgi:hypothetical protein
MRKAHRGVILGSTLLLAAAALGLGGCTPNPTPGMVTLSQTQSEVDNRLTLIGSENGRMFNADLGRVFYLDRPSRLAPSAIPW